MKKLMTLSLAVMLLAFAPAAMSQRYVERHSTDAGNDLQRVSFAGKIHSISGQIATVHADDGQIFNVHLGPRWYWHERGYNLRSGIRVSVSGWFDDDDRHSCFAGSISGSGFSFELANSDGFPHWADPDNRRGFRPRLDCYEQHYYRAPVAVPPWWHRRSAHWRHDNRHWGNHHRDYCPPPRHHGRDYGYGHDRGHGRDRDGNDDRGRGRRGGRRSQ